jgi:hypothetical protein
MAIQTQGGPIYTIEEVLAGKLAEVTPAELERRRLVSARIDALRRKMQPLPPGYVEELIRSGRDNPEADNDPRPGEST